MLNNCIIMGRLVRNPELKKTKNNNGVCDFTIACQRESKDDAADFIDCKCFNAAAENLAKYLHKGDKVIVAGNLQTHAYEDKNSITHKVTELIAQKIYYPDKKFADDEDVEIPQ